ncbi:MAG: D-aminoacyl-tRNA deacylase [Candidatus Binatia bacterium]
MRAVIQRVSRAEVSVAGQPIAAIGPGLCVFLGVARDDDESNADRLADKLKKLRIFADDNDKMNRSLDAARNGVLVVSEFTLYGDSSKGNRPSFSAAAAPAIAEKLYDYFVQRMCEFGLPVATGQFGASMEVALTNDGPVTFIVES